MKVGIVGTGAMGSVYAALFAEAEHDVCVADTWTEHIDAINAGGLRLTGATGDRVVEGVRAVDDISRLDVCDMYVLATKVADVGNAAAALARVSPPNAPVVAIQNGFGAIDEITTHIDPSRIVIGVAQGFGARIAQAGHAHHDGMQMLRLGEVGGGMSDRLTELTKVWADAGFPAVAFDDLDQLMWEKFVVNVALGGPCLISGLTAGGLLASTDWRPVAMGCAREAFAVAAARGVTLSYDDPEAYVDAFVAKVEEAKPSMLQDFENGRPSEIDSINGQVCVLGRAADVPTPYNDTVVATVHSLEAANVDG